MQAGWVGVLWVVLGASAAPGAELAAVRPGLVAPEELKLGGPDITGLGRADDVPASGDRGWYVYTGYIAPLDENRGGDLYHLALGYSYPLLDRLTVSPEMAAYYVHQDGPDTPAVGANLLLRARLLDAPRFTGYVEAGGGVFEAFEQVPDGGTRFNFTLLGGVGATAQLRDDLRLMAGARYWHLSNAFIEGQGRNPSQDGIELYVGLVFWR
jgi:hypothetical protein